MKTKPRTITVLPLFLSSCPLTEINKLCISGCRDSRPAPGSRPKQPATRPIRVAHTHAHLEMRASEQKLAPGEETARASKASLTDLMLKKTQTLSDAPGKSRERGLPLEEKGNLVVTQLKEKISIALPKICTSTVWARLQTSGHPDFRPSGHLDRQIWLV